MNNLIINSSVGLKGEYHIVKRNNKNQVTGEYHFDNLITNVGLNNWGSVGAFTTCYIGTGTNPPLVTDVSLGNLSAASTISVGGSIVSSGAPNYNVIRTTGRRFAQGVLNGNYTEVGMGLVVGGSVNLFSRSLILDNLGNPTTITVLPSEVLDVYYILTIIIDKTLRSGTINVNGTPVDYNVQITNINSGLTGSGDTLSFPPTNRFGSVANGSRSLSITNGAFQSDVTGTGFGAGGTGLAGINNTFSIGTYITDSYYNDVSFLVGINDGNSVPFDKYSYATQFGRYAVALDMAPITKLNTQTLTVGARYSWNRI